MLRASTEENESLLPNKTQHTLYMMESVTVNLSLPTTHMASQLLRLHNSTFISTTVAVPHYLLVYQVSIIRPFCQHRCHYPLHYPPQQHLVYCNRPQYHHLRQSHLYHLHPSLYSISSTKDFILPTDIPVKKQKRWR
jgi:hypothetical protein